MLQLKKENTAGRFYAPERDLLNCLPRLTSTAIKDAGMDEEKSMMDLANILVGTFEDTLNPQLTIKQVLDRHTEFAAEINEKAYKAFLHSFFLTVMDYHIAARREVPAEQIDGDMDERVLLELHDYIVKRKRWPFWRRWISNIKQYVRNLLVDPPDTLSRPVVGLPDSPPQ